MPVEIPKNQNESQEKFDIDQAILKEPDFVSFLTKLPDQASIDMEDSETLEKYHKVFLMSKDLDGIDQDYKTDIENLIGAPIEGEQAEGFKSQELLINAYTNNPEAIEMLEVPLEKYKKLAEETKELEKEVEKLSGSEKTLEQSVKELETQRKELLDARKTTESWFGGKLTWLSAAMEWFISGDAKEAEKILKNPDISDEQRAKAEETLNYWTEGTRGLQARKLVKEKYGISLSQKSLDKKLGEIEIEMVEKVQKLTAMDQTGRLEEIKNIKGLQSGQFQTLRRQIFEGVLPVREIFTKAKKQIYDRMVRIIKNPAKKASSSFSEAQQFYDKLVLISNGYDGEEIANGVDANILSQFKETEFQKGLAKTIEDRAREDIEKNFARADYKEKNLNHFVENILGFATRGILGSKKGEEVRKFVLETLEDIAEDLGKGTDQESLAKILIAKRIMAKIKNHKI